MRTRILLLVPVCLLLLAAQAPVQAPARFPRGAARSAATPRPDRNLRGFSLTAAHRELIWERRFDRLPQGAHIRAVMQHLSAYPHHLGSPYDYQNALWILHKFQQYGLDAHIEKFMVLFPTPKQRLVEMVAPKTYKAKLKEPSIAADPTSGQSGQLPTYNAYSGDGDVTASLVYVNYGVPADYARLAKLGINVQGKIVLARYGHSWRGIKPKLAHQHGAIGCIIYSDPRDDGYFQGDVFPKGPFRPWQGVQRGSVMEMEKYPGDPSTPGWGSTPGARHLPLNQITNLEKIPVLPISYGDALPLLRALGGPVAPPSWRGALPVTYHLGPGPARVHLIVRQHWQLVPLYDVIAKIPGRVWPGQWVIRGNHFDAWVNGAADPISGQASLLEEAKAYGQLLHQGWRPRRTIIYCAWDGEEPGLLGSTEWCETHAAALQQHAVAYLNSDTSMRGILGIGGSHSLERFANEVATALLDPHSRETLWQMQVEARARALRKTHVARPLDGHDLHIGALGSGSDYSPFLQHLGIPTLDLGFYNRQPFGQYHSIYDDFYWYTHFGDPGFRYERKLAQVFGTAVMRLADAQVLPLEYGDFADTISRYDRQLHTLARRQGNAGFSLSELDLAAARARRAAAAYDRAYRRAAGGGALFRQSSAALGRLDAGLAKTEQALLNPAGLPRRPWYRHTIYAPGYYTGYGVKTMPGIREALEQKNYAEAAFQERKIVAALNRWAARLAHLRAEVQ